jgi:hypothetical protein
VIFTWLADLLLVAILFGINLMLPYKPPTGVSLAVLKAANFVLPLSEVLAFFGLMGAYVVASLGYMAIVRIVNWVRGAG